MKPIGGFFELELPAGANCYHPSALALSTGRACLSVILRQLKPRLFYVPFYSCDALYEPLKALGIPFRYYAIHHDLRPAELPTLQDDEYILWINYFGIQDNTAQALLEHYGQSLIVDDTHRFFNRGYKENYSFTSARKYFGVPDGAYLYGPRLPKDRHPRFQDISVQHNVNRFLGLHELAYRQFRHYEESLTHETHRISKLSERLLSLIDYDFVETRRSNNFAHMHAQFSHTNQLDIDPSHATSPFCYPLLLQTPLDRTTLHEAGLFVPTLWPDVYHRDIDGFQFEKTLSRNILPLPIDHRYSTNELDRLIGHIKDRIR